jgi:hypothetical protein
MGDRFDSTNYPTTEPRQLVVGDRWVWKRTDLTDYPPATYDLSYLLRDVNDGTREITITASESGTDYLVEVASSTTSGYVPGRYRWLAYITRTSDSERMTLASGYTEVVPNTGGENVETAHMDFLRERVRVLRTAITALSSKTVTSYSIGDRTLTYQDIPTMVTEYNKAMAEIEQMESAGRIARGRDNPRRVGICATSRRAFVKACGPYVPRCQGKSSYEWMGRDQRERRQ